MRRRPEHRLGYTDDRNAVLGPDMSAQARPASGIKVDVAIDHDQRQLLRSRGNNTQRWEFAAEELSRLIWRARDNHRGLCPGHRGEGPVVCSHHSRSGRRIVQIVDIDGNEQARDVREHWPVPGSAEGHGEFGNQVAAPAQDHRAGAAVVPGKPQLVDVSGGTGSGNRERVRGRLGRVSGGDRFATGERPAGMPEKRIVASGAKRLAKAVQSPDRTLSLKAATCAAARWLIGSSPI